ncbi:MAG: ISLre2 family transposase, partial [Acetobacteraceae bacterium]|nr:ISLre2 family transposase [Acetobacteraceae bacterium]
TGRSVYLLDERLKLEKSRRVSPGLAELAVGLGAEGAYRGASDRLARYCGGRVISHEGVRRQCLRAGERIRAGEGQRGAAWGGKRVVGAIFVVADGLWVSVRGRGRREVKMSVTHEGWEVRQGRGDTTDYALVGARHHTTLGGAGELWAATYSSLCSEFDLERSTVVVCGDDAGWIREALEYFPGAMFQRDRYHVARDLRVALAHLPRRREAALRQLQAGNVAAVVRELAEGRDETPPGPARERLSRLAASVAEGAHEIMDYRLRLKALGRPVSPHWRGPGVAESQVKRYKDRLRGAAWSVDGLEAMLALLDRRFDGTLEDALAGLDGELKPQPPALKGLLPRQVPLAVGHGSYGVRQGHFPALDGPAEGFAALLRELGRIKPL